MNRKSLTLGRVGVELKLLFSFPSRIKNDSHSQLLYIHKLLCTVELSNTTAPKATAPKATAAKAMAPKATATKATAP